MSLGHWWVKLIVGIVGIGLGLLILLQRESTTAWVGVAGAIYLIIAGGLGTLDEMTTSRATRSRLRLYQAVLGLAAGAALLLLAWTEWLERDTAWWIMAVALIAFGGLGVFIGLFSRRGPVDWGGIAVNALLLAWGALAFWSLSSEGFDLPTVTGWILLAVGVLGVVWAFWSRNQAPLVPDDGLPDGVLSAPPDSEPPRSAAQDVSAPTPPES